MLALKNMMNLNGFIECECWPETFINFCLAIKNIILLNDAIFFGLSHTFSMAVFVKSNTIKWGNSGLSTLGSNSAKMNWFINLQYEQIT